MSNFPFCLFQHPICAGIFLFHLAVVSSTAASQDVSFQLNDIVRAPIKGQVYQGKIMAIKSKGKYLNITFQDGMGNSLNKTVPSSEVTFVSRPSPSKPKSSTTQDRQDAKTNSSRPTKTKTPTSEYREWVDRNGEPLFTARFMDQLDGLARFEQNDGKVVGFQLRELNILDRILVYRMTKKVSEKEFVIGENPKVGERRIIENKAN